MLGWIIGWLFVVAALGAGVFDFAKFIETKRFEPVALGRLWYLLDPGTLNLSQAVIERYIHPFLWLNVIAPFLTLPAAMVFGIIGLLILLFTMRASRRR